jgi:UDP:flavonoid glycosyltransferase YjiC (YdhE family)
VSLTEFPLYDDSHHWVPSPELVRFLEAGEPPLVFTKPSGYRSNSAFIEQAADACHLLGRRGIFVGVEEPHSAKQVSSAFAVFGYVPLSWLLPRGTALIHHGGVGTSALALAAGTPQLIRPINIPQASDARRLCELGVAVKYTPWFPRATGFAQVLQRLLGSPEIASRCQLIAKRMADQKQMKTACEMIERIGTMSS